MSATLAVFLKEMDPHMNIEIHEVPGSAIQQSSNAWNNAGTGHAALCELNYTPRQPGGSIDISRALQVNAEFELSRQAGRTIAGSFQHGEDHGKSDELSS